MATATIQFDTSGFVDASGPGYVGMVSWPDLDPFTQGYVEAMLSPSDDRTRTYQVGAVEVHRRPATFSDLAPETLARIVEDCEWSHSFWGMPRDCLAGRTFWELRQAEPSSSNFPPLTPYLGDDGKVYLRERN